MNFDPLREDLWVAPPMGPYHLFLAGSPTALCGHEWVHQSWAMRREPPDSLFACSRCWKLWLAE